TENIKMLNKVSRQVSHDIRSPLAALSVALEDISTLPEKNRVILKLAIQRIQDIANNLLKNSNKDDSTLSATLISTVIDEILSEKRVQYKALSTISIERSFEDELNLFAIINHSQLKQIISNLINNSVEAIDKKNGKVEVKIYKDKNQAIIEVLDNGKGIPVEILNQLGKGNISFGKDDLEFAGFGIGVKHAFDTIQSWGGNISISSYEGIGTSFKINLPLAPAPSWFINKLEFSCGQVILVLDDDHEIHQVWEKKLEDLSLTRHHFYNSKLLLDWIHNNPNTDFILLSDYELIGDISTGLDLIKKLDIQDRSILVTSHYEDVIKQDSTIKVIPKNIVSSIHICVDEKVLF
ncbi:MAG: HAMP domain-containing sensor histidine kinase, partial [Bacteriovoracaceae bacterium]